MADEQLERFDSMKKLVAETATQLESLRDITDGELTTVDNESSSQAETLQRVQHLAGAMVSLLTETSEVARHARSYQAQKHQQNSGNRPR